MGTPQSPQVIVLNGGSSAGKSGISRCLQAILSGPWLRLGVDDLVDRLPPSLHSGDGVTFGAHGSVATGPGFRELEAAWLAGVAAMAKAGGRIVYDDVFLSGAASQQKRRAHLDGVSVVVTSRGQDEPLAQTGACLAAVPGVLVERSTEDLAGRGPVPVATMPGGAPLYEDGDQQALAEQLRDRLRPLVEAALPGQVEDGPVNYGTTRTPTGTSRNLLASVDWRDERGHITVLALQLERMDEPRLPDCAGSDQPAELDCATVTPEGGAGPVVLFTGSRSDRNAVLALADGSGVTSKQMLRTHAPAEPESGELLREVTPRPDLPLSDQELAAVADSLAR